MDALDWNLDQREFQTVEITQIQFIQGQTDLSDSQEKLRLLVLSHQIAQFGVPAFFLESAPKYLQENFTTEPVVIVYDFENKFQDFMLPQFFKSSSFTIDFSITFTKEIIDHIQRSIILLYYYKYFDNFPIYHSSFLLFSCTGSWYDQFLLHFIPLRFRDRLRFRILILTNLQIQIDTQSPLKERSIILISPFEHPFLVISSTTTQITVQYVDESIHTFTRSEITISQILKPSPSLIGAYQDLKTIRSLITPSSETFSQMCQSGSKSFAISKEELHDFFQKKIDEQAKKEMEELQIESSEFEDLPASIDVILSEQIPDLELRMQISKSLKPLCLFPSKKQDVLISITPYDTFYERNYGISKMSIPTLPSPFFTKTTVQSIKIEIPNVIVAQKGQLFEASAKNVIKNWINELYRPISGPKNAHFVVFADSLLRENHTKQFFSHLTHTYSLLGFGELTIYPKINAFFFSNPEDVKNNVFSFMRKNQQLEFSTFPTVIFIIVDKDYSHSIRLNMPTILISPHDVNVGNFDYFKLISFHIYSRIRIRSPEPDLDLSDFQDCPQTSPPNNLHKFKPLDIFFGFRYQPPFLLQRIQDTVLILYVFWDPISTESVWTDDTGSTLHSTKMKNLFTIIATYEELKKVFNDIKLILSIGIFFDNVSPKFIESLIHVPNVNLFTINPAPFVQVSFSTKVDEDSIIFTE